MGIIYKDCGHGEFDTPYTCNPCPDGEGGRIRSLVLVKKGTEISIPLDAEEWEADIVAGNIIILPEVRGSFDGGTPRMVAGYGSNTEIKVGDDYVLNVSDPAYADNAVFWEESERHTWNICYVSEKVLVYVPAEVQLMAKAPIDEDLNAVVDWDIELRWFSRVKPIVAGDYADIKNFFRCGMPYPVQSIDTPVFELGLTFNYEDHFEWGNTIEFTPANATDKRLTYSSSDPTIATVDNSGDIDMLSNYAVDGFKFCTITATSVDGGHIAECLVVNNEDFGIFKFNFGGGDFTAEFYESCHLVKPNGDIVALTTGVAVVDVPAGVCHLIYEKTNTVINLDGMPIIGELKTLHEGDFYCNNCTSLTTLSAPMAFNLNCYNCTSLTTLSAPMASSLGCEGCTSLTTLSAPMATELNCSGCALTATSIASILADAVSLPDLSNINFDFTGGTNAAIGTWSAQAIVDKNVIIGATGTVLFNS